jgi:opacity protein-like surface antigen
MTKHLLGVLVLSMAIASTAHTQGSRFALGPQLGIYRAQDADDVRLMGGAAARLRLSEAFGIEGSVNYRQEEYHGGSVKVTSWPVMVTGLIYPIRPLYGAIGAGWYNSSIEYRLLPGPLVVVGTVSSESKQRFGWHFGGGLELPVGSAAKLVGDIRYVFLDYDFKNLPGTNGVRSDFYVITAGLMFGL